MVNASVASMKMIDIPIDTPFRIVDNQWFNQFGFARLNDSQIQNLDTGDIGEINSFLEVELISGVFVAKDPERLKRYYARNGAGKSFI